MAKKKEVALDALSVKGLKGVLNIVKPAISSKDFIPIFSHFCFDDDLVTGYSEPIGIQVEFKSGITGGVKGDTLLTWLNGLPDTNNITFENKDNHIKFNSGRSKLELALIEKADFIFEKPSEEGTEIIINEEFINAIGKCSGSVVPDSDIPSMAGITVTYSNQNMFFHSTNGLAISEYVMEWDQPFETFILPDQFCTVLRKLYKEGSVEGSVVATVSESSVVVTFNETNTVLWSKLLPNKAGALDFDEEINNALEGFDLQGTFEVTDNLIQTMHRILNVYGTSTKESKLVQLESKGTELELSVSKENIQLQDEVTIDTKQAKIKALIDLEKLVSVLHPGCGMAMLPKLVLVTSESFTYLQAFKA